MKTLILAEKPELGRAIAAAVNATERERQGVIQKGDLTITWAYGHLLRLKEPEEYDPKYKQWKKEDLPIVFDEWQQVPDGDKANRVAQIGTLISNADQIIHAGDPDDEGQYLIDEILDYHHCDKPVKRLYINDNTPELIRRSIKEMKDNDESCRLAGRSAYARAVADYVVGINYTRLFSVSLRKKAMSVGRVQSPTLGLIVARDLQIETHQKQVYYELDVDVEVDNKQVKMKYKPSKAVLNDEKNILDRSILDELKEKLTDQLLKVKVEQKENSQRPPLPYNLAKLQAAMNVKYGYDLSRTDRITQTLRDRYQAITYNRSDSQYLKEEHYQEAGKLLPFVMNKLGLALPLDYTLHSECFNDQFVTAHHAIIPTMSNFNIKALSEEEMNVYTEICNMYFMQFLPPIQKLQTTLSAPVDGGELRLVLTKILDQGYRQYFQEIKENDDGEESDELEFKPGKYDGRVLNSVISEKATNPPKHYTQASLIRDMTSIAKYVEDPEVKKILKAKDKDKKGENGSIGTSATRSTIVETLIKRGYVEMKGKQILSTQLGRDFYQILPDEIKKADCTARWWVIQEDIKEGKADVADLVKTVVDAFMPNLEKTIYMDSRESLGVCPICGHKIVEYPKSFGCTNYRNGCKFAIWKNDFFLTSINKVPTALMAKKLIKDHWCQVRLANDEIKLLIMHIRNGKPVFELRELPKKKETAA